MTAQAVLVLVEGWKYNRDSIAGTDPGYVSLGRTNYRGNGKRDDLIGAVRTVTIHARSMAIIVEDGDFGSVVEIGSSGQRMTYFRNFSHHIGRRRRQQSSAIVASHTILSHGIGAGHRWIGRAKQPRRRG